MQVVLALCTKTLADQYLHAALSYAMYSYCTCLHHLQPVFTLHTARHESGHVTVQACSGSDACNYVCVLVSLQGSKYATCVFLLSTRSLPFAPE